MTDTPRLTSRPGIAAGTSEQELADELVALLIRSLRALGDAGDSDLACRLAAAAWRAVEHGGHPAGPRFTGLLHYLTRPRATAAPTSGDDMPDSDTTQQPDTVLDVRDEVPARRHQLIFDTYGRLQPGTGFVLVNDHDPKPLYYQFAAEHAGAFEWDYLEEGPAVWRVRIGRPVA